MGTLTGGADRRYPAVWPSSVRHVLPDDAGRRCHSVQLDAIDAAIGANDLPLHGDIIRTGNDAWWTGDAVDDAARRQVIELRRAEISHQLWLGDGRAGDVA